MDYRSLLKKMLSIPSLTPHDHGCQDLIASVLTSLGFTIEWFVHGDVRNMWATFGPSHAYLVFAGHTDVVPAGNYDHWLVDPFQPTEIDGKLYARGAADMKTALVCMVEACRLLLEKPHPLQAGIGFLVTSCEEEDTPFGTKWVVDELYHTRQLPIQWCVVGEASSEVSLGDQIRVGRRGSLSGNLTVIGKQGHVAYAELALNPIHQVAPVLAELAKHQWDTGYDDFPPTSFQITNIHAGLGANNVIPGELSLQFNFRYSPAVEADMLRQQVEYQLQKHHVDYHIDWHHSGKPFRTQGQFLIQAVSHAIKMVTGLVPRLSTGGGTSDARFIAPHGIETIELGFVNETIHKENECVLLSDIPQLIAIYEQILDQVVVKKHP